MISSPIESWDWWLSIGEDIVENGHHHQKIWPFQIVMSLAVSNHLRLFNWTNTLSILILEYGRQFSQGIDIFVSISPETTTSGDHNFWCWGPFSMISSQTESWDWGLSIGESIVENGYHHQTLWWFGRFVIYFVFKQGPQNVSILESHTHTHACSHNTVKVFI